MTNDRTILITGVTGQQGGAVAQALQRTGFRLRGLTRKPDSERAAALARQGVDVVKGDLDDEATLRPALAGCPRTAHCKVSACLYWISWHHAKARLGGALNCYFRTTKSDAPVPFYRTRQNSVAFNSGSAVW